MSDLKYLVDEIRAGLEIFHSTRTGGQYYKTAFILCDDYCELLSKLFLVTRVSNWSDTDRRGHFKSYAKVLEEVEALFTANRPNEVATLQPIVKRMKDRRKRRNDFFHTTRLLDLSVGKHHCVQGFCDLIEYGSFLFGPDWSREIQACRELETLCVLLQLERLSFNDSRVIAEVDNILKDCPRRDKERNVKKKGTQYVEHPEDLHLRLCVIWGGRDFTDKLTALLSRLQSS